MCGIVGIVRASNQPVERTRLSAASEVLSYRGPDDAGLWLEGGAGLAHRRLSVLDVSAAGHQPMVSADSRYVIVFNGEIYNFRNLRAELEVSGLGWRSCSDTEVILNAYARWGAACLARLRGMFAFAIWDRIEKSLFVARDRIGVKPLYYCQGKWGFAFASRPRALRALIPDLDWKIDAQGLRYYLDIGYFPGAYSVFENVRRVPPAHYLTVDEKGLTVHRYWNLADIRPDPAWEAREEHELLDELDELVWRGVESRLVSDVPLGAFLSGGIDSSLVVAMMSRRASAPVKTFSIGFNETEHDESGYASAVAAHLGTEHHNERVGVDDLLDLLPTFRREYDEPFFDSSAFPTMAVSRLARRYVTVSLSGDGGDELFGGYHYYRIVAALNPFYRLPQAVRRALAHALRLLPAHRAALLAGALTQRSHGDVFAFVRSIAKDFPNVMIPDVLTETQGITDLFHAVCADSLSKLAPEEQAMRLDMLFTLPDEYLQKLDVASMAFSLEARDPLLDHELVQWAMKLPLCWKLNAGESKYLLKRLAYRYIPRELLDRPKKGFEVPIARWLRGPLKEWARERVNDRSAFDRLPLDQTQVLALFEAHCTGRRDAHPILWAVLMLMDFVSIDRQGVL